MPWFMKLLDYIMDMSDPMKKFIGWIVIAGAVIGKVLFFIGMFALGLGSLIMVAGGILAPIFAAISAFFSFFGMLIAGTGIFGKLGLALLIFLGVMPAVQGATKNAGSMWEDFKNTISNAITSIVGKLDELWDRFLDSSPIQTFLESMGITGDQIEKIKNPIKTIKEAFKSFFEKMSVQIFGFEMDWDRMVAFIGNAIHSFLSIYKTKFKIWFDELIPETAKTDIANLVTSLETIATALDKIATAGGKTWDAIGWLFGKIEDRAVTYRQEYEQANYPEGREGGVVISIGNLTVIPETTVDDLSKLGV